jgi:hypothetical protein
VSDVAWARITLKFTDGAQTEIEVGAVGAHPDLLDELVTRCERLYRKACPDEAEADDDQGAG